VNAIYGALAAAGLWVFGAPYPLFWGAVGAGLRFIPYIGPVIASVGPILISLAALPGWTRPLEVLGFYVLLELFTNLVLEAVLYADAAGVSQVALLVAVAFWTWLWGPLGLLMATPLTVCLVVLGKHVPGLTFVATMLSDSPALAPEYGYYQRLLARDVAEAADLIDRFVKAQPAENVYDALLVPALNYAERDRLEDQLSTDDEQAVGTGRGTDERRSAGQTWLAPPPKSTKPSRRRSASPGGRHLGASATRRMAKAIISLDMLMRLLAACRLSSSSGDALLRRISSGSSASRTTRRVHRDLPPSAPEDTVFAAARRLPELSIVVTDGHPGPGGRHDGRSRTPERRT
jgi:hypothetical protein